MAIKMNKVANKSKRVLKFEDLERGDIFQNEYGSWFIVTSKIFDDCGDFAGNAITLDGHIAIFGNDETVIKLKKDLTIDYTDEDIIEWYED